MESKSSYLHFEPSEKVSRFIHSFWVHKNLYKDDEVLTISTDGFFKIIIYVKDNKVVKYFITGLWIEPRDVIVPKGVRAFGCRFKVLAPEFMLQRTVKLLKNKEEDLEYSFLNIEQFDFDNPSKVFEQWEDELLKIQSNKTIPQNKLQLSNLLYEKKGDITVAEVANQIFWSDRQINRYLNKYLGVSLKTYLNAQRAYNAFFYIRDGKLSPKDEFYDQAHFIKEIKKHTGETPKKIYKHQNDRFLQLKHIKKK